MKNCNRLFVLVMTLLLVACSSSKDTAKAESAITDFRKAMTAQQFEQIYDSAGEDWRKATTKEESVKFLAAVERKLGGVQESTRTGWRVNIGTGGKIVTLGYHTKFERGEGDETFIYRIKDNKSQMLGYHVNSMQLIAD
jgi:hypothetical protein